MADGITFPLDPLIDELAPELKAILERREKQALRRRRSGDLTAEMEHIAREVEEIDAEEPPNARDLLLTYGIRLTALRGEIDRRIYLARVSGKPQLMRGGGLPPGFLSDLKARLDLVDVAQRLGVHGLRYVRADEWMGLCPDDRHNPGFHIYGQRWYCFCPRHGQGGDVFELVLTLRGGEWTEAVRWLAEGIGWTWPREAAPRLSIDSQKAWE